MPTIPRRIRRNVLEVALDYLAVGIDPAEDLDLPCNRRLPALPELTMLYINLVTVARLERNPTIKDEIRRAVSSATFRRLSLLSGAQAADITAFKATCRAGRR